MVITDTTKTRRQGNSLVVTVPSAFHIKENTVLKPRLTSEGILYEFVDEPDDSLDFDVDILRDLTNKGLTGEELITEFTRMKKAIPKAMDKLAQEAEKEPVMTEEELRKEIGL